MEHLPFEPIETSKIYMQVIDQITALLRNETLKRGDRLPPEAQIAQQLGVSRPSVREALKALEALGIIESKAGVGSFVKESISPDAVFSLLYDWAMEGSPLEFMEARKTIEPQVAFLAALRRTENDLRTIDHVLNLEVQEVKEGRSTVERNMEFHLLLAAACGNRLLADCMRLTLRRMQRRFWEVMIVDSLGIPEHSAVYLGHHRKIVQAIDEQNASRAEAIMLEHLETVAAGLAE